MVKPHLMSHDSATRLHGLPYVRPQTDLVHITRFGVGGSRTELGVKHHLTQLGLLTAVVVDELKATGQARTALDMAREHGFIQGVAVMDAVRRRGVSLADLEEELRLMSCWPNVTRARGALEVCDPGAQTLGETLTRLLLLELDLGPLITQFPILAARHLYFVDALIGPHAFEFDGFKKFARSNSKDDPSQVAWEEKQRQDAINREDVGVSRVIWSDLLGRQRAETGRRLRAEWEQSVRRFGESIPERHMRFFKSEEGQRLRSRQLREE